MFLANLLARSRPLAACGITFVSSPDPWRSKGGYRLMRCVQKTVIWRTLISLPCPYFVFPQRPWKNNGQAVLNKDFKNCTLQSNIKDFGWHFGSFLGFKRMAVAHFCVICTNCRVAEIVHAGSGVYIPEGILQWSPVYAPFHHYHLGGGVQSYLLGLPTWRQN